MTDTSEGYLPPENYAGERARITDRLRFDARKLDSRGKCGACHGVGFLRANVPIEHRLFGQITPCVCHPQYEQFGGKWYRA